MRTYSPGPTLAKLFRMIAILSVVSVLWGMYANAPAVIISYHVGYTSDNYILYMYIYNFIHQTVSNGLALAAAALMLVASKHMAPPQRSALRAGSMVSIIAIAVYLSYLLVQTVWSARAEHVVDESFFDIALFFANTQIFSALIALLAAASKLVCAGCFLTHPHKGVRTFAIATLASGGLQIVLKFLLSRDITTLLSGILFVHTAVAGILAAVFYFMISRSYHDNKGADEA